jgi:hypothetical protein
LSITVATPGTLSSTSHGRSCPSRNATGPQSVNHCEDWYQFSNRSTTSSITVAGAARNVVGIISGIISEKLIIAHYAASSNG